MKLLEITLSKHIEPKVLEFFINPSAVKDYDQHILKNVSDGVFKLLDDLENYHDVTPFKTFFNFCNTFSTSVYNNHHPSPQIKNTLTAEFDEQISVINNHILKTGLLKKISKLIFLANLHQKEKIKSVLSTLPPIYFR